ncbi:MAG: DNA/RNA non-specific endonuclease [Bacteroidota bacterium]
MRLFKFIILILFVYLFSGCTPVQQERFEWPLLKDDDELIVRTYYAVSYNTEHNLANWAAYSLKKRHAVKCVERKNYYYVDTLVSTGSPVYDDYSRSGYDRGHLVPARDMLFNKTASKEASYMTNITPQTPAFNRGIWKRLENKARQWAGRYDSVMIVSGPLIEGNADKIGKENKISVPEKYYKAFLVHNDTITETIGFVILNYKNKEKFKNDLYHYAITVNELEELTDLDFWPMLPPGIEREAEKAYNLEFWQLDKEAD